MPAIDADAGLYHGTAGPPPVRDTGGGVRAVFHLEPVLDEAESAKEGRPIYHDREFVRIHVPGDKTNIPDRSATDADKARFSKEYALFKAGDAEQVTGTPLREWPGCTRGQILELAHFGIKTVEQLSEVSDGNIVQIGPIRALREKARDFLAAAKKQAPATQLRAEMKEMASQNAAMKEEIAQLRELLNQKTDPKTATKAG